MALHKPRIFYGWWVVAASFVIALYIAGVVFYGFTAIFIPIADELGWSYTQISLAASLRGLEMGLLAPLTGILADRWGPRRLVFAGGIFTAGGLYLLSRTNSLAMFYGAFLLIAVGMSFCTTNVLMTAVSHWFRRRVGTATGIAVAGFGFGGVLVPLIVGLIDAQGWRYAMTVFSLGALVVVLPLSLVFRHKPEQYGYLPDGETAPESLEDSSVHGSPAPEVNITTSQALRSRTFWLLASAYTLHIMIVGAIVTHVIPYLRSIDISLATAGLVATAIPLVSIAGRLCFGWLGDRMERKRVSAITFILMVPGGLCFSYVSAGAWLLVPFLLLFALGYGGGSALRPALVREFFGRVSFGTIFGMLIGVNMIGNMVGPPLAGWVFDTWGSYQGIWLVFAGLAGVALVMVLLVSPLTAKEG